MSTVRAIVNNKRVSTARQISSSAFQQFFPAYVSFKDENEWKDIVKRMFGDTVTFEIDDSPPSPTTPAPTPVPKVNPFDSYLNSKDWTFSSMKKQTFPRGKYWIGDICYCLNDKVYDSIFGGFNYESGYYKHKSDAFFMVDSTAYGDGLYMGTDGFEYGVDAGIIGIVSAELIDESQCVDGGKIYNFTAPVTCRFKNGKFIFESGSTYLSINTTGYNDTDD
jgi:hypothetical protein